MGSWLPCRASPYSSEEPRHHPSLSTHHHPPMPTIPWGPAPLRAPPDPPGPIFWHSGKEPSCLATLWLLRQPPQLFKTRSHAHTPRTHGQQRALARLASPPLALTGWSRILRVHPGVPPALAMLGFAAGWCGTWLGCPQGLGFWGALWAPSAFLLPKLWGPRGLRAELTGRAFASCSPSVFFFFLFLFFPFLEV